MSRNIARIAKIIATFFGAGLSPKAPGTLGSLAALPFAWYLFEWGGAPALMLATILVFLVGVWAAGRYANEIGLTDPSAVVIDEVAGQWLTLLVVPNDLILYGLGFVLFRMFDIFKPWPVSWADQKIKGGFGIMFDDILAGVYAGVILFGIRYWFGG